MSENNLDSNEETVKIIVSSKPLTHADLTHKYMSSLRKNRISADLTFFLAEEVAGKKEDKICLSEVLGEEAKRIYPLIDDGETLSFALETDDGYALKWKANFRGEEISDRVDMSLVLPDGMSFEDTFTLEASHPATAKLKSRIDPDEITERIVDLSTLRKSLRSAK